MLEREVTIESTGTNRPVGSQSSTESRGLVSNQSVLEAEEFITSESPNPHQSCVSMSIPTHTSAHSHFNRSASPKEVRNSPDPPVASLCRHASPQQVRACEGAGRTGRSSTQELDCGGDRDQDLGDLRRAGSSALHRREVEDPLQDGHGGAEQEQQEEVRSADLPADQPSDAHHGARDNCPASEDGDQEDLPVHQSRACGRSWVRRTLLPDLPGSVGNSTTLLRVGAQDSQRGPVRLPPGQVGTMGEVAMGKLFGTTNADQGLLQGTSRPAFQGKGQGCEGARGDPEDPSFTRIRSHGRRQCEQFSDGTAAADGGDLGNSLKEEVDHLKTERPHKKIERKEDEKTSSMGSYVEVDP